MKDMFNAKNKQAKEFEVLISTYFANDGLSSKFLERIREREFTKDEDSRSHLCAYFAAYDSKARKVFIGHHKKSGLWLFNGGHIDEGETMEQTLAREIGEEWGLDANDFEINRPAMLSITEIHNPEKQPCNWHFDIWNFLDVDKNTFKPDEKKVLEEFYEFGWKNLKEARELIKDKHT